MSKGVADNLKDVAAERAVLAGVCKYGADAWVDVEDLISAKTFSSDFNKSIYECIKYIFAHDSNAEIDMPTLTSTAQSLGCLKHIDDPQYLRSIFNMPIKQGTVQKMAAKLFKLALIRDLKTDVINNVNKKLNSFTGDESIDEIIASVETPVLDFTNSLGQEQSNTTPKRIGEGIEEYIEWLMENERDLVGISTGYPILDDIIGGLRGSTITVFGARPKTGKTMLADNIALHVAGKLGIPVLNLDTEMNETDHWNRMLANISGVETKLIEKGKFKNTTKAKKAVIDAGAFLKSIPYDYLSISGRHYEETITYMRRWLFKEVGKDAEGNWNPCVFVFDYLKLMNPDGLQAVAEFQMLGFMVTALHNFAKKYDVPVIAFIQLNRDGILSETSATVSGSDRIVWLCSNYIIYKEKTPEEVAEYPDAGSRKMVLVATRHGEPLAQGDYINYHFDGTCASIREGQTRNNCYKLNKKNSSFDTTGIDENESIPFGR